MFLSTAFLILTLVHAIAPTDWTYGDNEKWRKINKICLEGKQQSPIAIDPAMAKVDRGLAENPLNFIGFEGQWRGIVENNGHTLKFGIALNDDFDDPVNTANYNITGQPRITGGQLPSKDQDYMFAQLHFHWGDTPQKGAEHIFAGQTQAPMEAHLVYYNKKYGDVKQASKYGDGIAVVGFLFDAFSANDDRSTDTDYSQFKPYIQQVTSELSNVTATIDLSKLVPKWARDGSGTFYRYNGSLTTPPCSEAVTWTVYEGRIPVENSLLEALIKLKWNKLNPQTNVTVEASMVNNFRSLQELNNRRVTTNRPIPKADGDQQTGRNGSNSDKKATLRLAVTMLALAAFFYRS